MDYSKKTQKELIDLCKTRGIRGTSGKNKTALIALLTTTPPPENVMVYNNTPSQAPPSSQPQPLPQPTFIEVCSGCGGLSTGLMNTGWKPILLNELIPTFCETLKKNHPGVAVENCDMLKLNLSKYKGQVDLLCGGVPCQAFSHAGERLGLDDPRGQLIVEFNRLVNECEPRILMVENVKGLTTHDGGATVQHVIQLFQNNGRYRVYTKVLNAKDYDVPQKRERIFIVGVRSDIATEFTYPEKSANVVLLKDVLTADIPASPGATYPEAKRRVMDLVPQGGCWVNLPEPIRTQYMGQKGLEAGGGKRGVARRLAMNEPCLTLTTSPAQRQTERCHPLETRPFTVREYARIQTFPDTYEFVGSMGNQYKQIGNAVPVKLSEAMGKRLKEFLLY